MSDTNVLYLTGVSPVLRYVLYLCDQGYSFDKAEEIARTVSHRGDDGLMQFDLDAIPGLPREAFPPPELLEDV